MDGWRVWGCGCGRLTGVKWMDGGREGLGMWVWAPDLCKMDGWMDEGRMDEGRAPAFTPAWMHAWSGQERLGVEMWSGAPCSASGNSCTQFRSR
eukprot:361780-Chlamydomonas_euryale.AAC.4